MARILVADDVAANRELLQAYLEPEGHEVIEADSGEAALDAVVMQPIDLVLLDVMMPGMNGFEVGAEIKRRARAEFLPVVLVTALRDPSSRDLGLRLSADDYLTKPVERGELLARVNNLLALRQRTLELAQRNRELVELHDFREEMASLLVHDLKNPLAVVMSNLDFVLESTLPEAEQEALQDARRGSQRVLRLLNNLLDVSRLESSRLPLTRSVVGVRSIVEPLARDREKQLARRGVRLEVPAAEDVALLVDGDVILRVLENILDNAARYVPRGGRIVFAWRRDGDGVTLSLGNDGAAIPVADRERVFEKYGQGEGTRRHNLGLGLYFCKLAVEAHGGRITVAEQPGLPTVFVLTLPGS